MTARFLRSGAALGTILLVSLASPAHGAGETNIDHVEVSEHGGVSVVLSVDGLPTGESPDLGSLTVSLDGKDVDATAEPLEAGEVQRTAILALDASLSMRGERFEAAKSAARLFVDSAPDDVEIGMLTFSGEVQSVTVPTTDHASIASAIEDIELSRGTLLFDAVLRAIDLAGPEGARSILVLSDGRDERTGATLKEVTSMTASNGIVIDVVALEQTNDTRDELATIADASGGRVLDAQSTAELEGVFAAQADALATQLLVQFEQPPGVSDEVSLAVSIAAGGDVFTDIAFVPLAAEDSMRAAPVKVEPTTPLVGESGLWIGAAALVAGLAGLLAFALLGSRGPSQLQAQMSFYSEDGQTRHAKPDAKSSAPSLRQSAISATQQMVKGDFETRLAQRLNGAGLAMTAAEWLLLHVGVALGAAFVGLILRGPALMIVLLLVGAAVPWLFLKVKHSRRLAAFNSQLAETLQLISGGLSAGLSMPQAVDTVVREGAEPMAGELRRALTEQRLGIEIEDALDGVAERMDSKDFSWVVMAIRIQREVGGNLAELLNTVSNTLRERDYLRRQVKVLSAEGRFSAWILGGMPIAMFLFLVTFRPHAVRPLYTEPLGLLMSAAAVGLLVLGFFVMSKLVKVEV